MKKVILFLSLFALLLSCAKDEGVGIENQPQPEESTYKVSVDQALKSLDIALANIDGETRSAKRSVKSIERVKASQVMDLTRSADIPQLEDLLYVVSFGEGQGSAVLGADKRVDEIFAILDQTVLTAEDLLPNKDTRSDGEQSQVEDLQDFLSDMIVDAAIVQVQDDDNIAPNNLITPMLKHPTYRTEEIHNHTHPILTTKWHQNSPFNMYCQNSAGQTCPAGCVAIAAGQILRYFQCPSNNTLGGVTFPWSTIAKFDYNYTGTKTQADRELMGRYIKKLGELLEMEYSPDGSGSNINKVNNLFKTLGMNTSASSSWDYYRIVRTISSNSKPVFMQGGGYDNTKNKDVAHAWVLDGLYTHTENIYETRYNDFGNPLPETLYFTETLNYVHCNFGYNGEHDGYYNHGLYDLNIRRIGYLIDQGYGDTEIARDLYFNKNFKVIYYNDIQ